MERGTSYSILAARMPTISEILDKKLTKIQDTVDKKESH